MPDNHTELTLSNNHLPLRSGGGVDDAELEMLGRMLYFADQAYEGESEGTLNGRLAKLGAPHPRHPRCRRPWHLKVSDSQAWVMHGLMCSLAKPPCSTDLSSWHQRLYPGPCAGMRQAQKPSLVLQGMRSRM